LGVDAPALLAMRHRSAMPRSAGHARRARLRSVEITQETGPVSDRY